jgi:predicted O-linked N-acetylglucosamine transferase (SPINDLY family)
VFANFNQYYKFSPEIVSAWLMILAAVPNRYRLGSVVLGRPKELRVL